MQGLDHRLQQTQEPFGSWAKDDGMPNCLPSLAIESRESSAPPKQAILRRLVAVRHQIEEGSQMRWGGLPDVSGTRWNPHSRNALRRDQSTTAAVPPVTGS